MRDAMDACAHRRSTRPFPSMQQNAAADERNILLVLDEQQNAAPAALSSLATAPLACSITMLARHALRSCVLLSILLLSSTARAQGYADLIALCNSDKLATCKGAKAQPACVKLKDRDQSQGIPDDDELKDLRSCLGTANLKAATTIHPSATSRGTGLESALIVGAGQFLVERAKAEVAAFFVDTIKDRMCDGKTKGYFPESCAVFGASTSDTPPDLITLGRAFRTDVTKLPAKLLKTIASRKPELACAAEIGVDVAIALQTNGEVLAVIAEANATRYPSCDQLSWKANFWAIIAAVKAIRDSQGSFELITSGRYETLIAIVFGSQDLQAKLAKYKPLLDAMQALLDATADPQAASTSVGQRRILTASLQLYKQVLLLVAPGNNMSTAPDLISQLVDAAANRDYGRIATLLLSAVDLAATWTDTNLEHLKRYLGLAAGLATANSSTEVAAVLEQAAAPLGGWKRKHVQRVGVSVTGFVGAALSQETLDSPSGTTMEPSRATTAAPFIGLGLDLHVHAFLQERVGLYATVLDLGSIASTRFNEKGGSDLLKVDDNPDVGFKQVFAPGAYLYASLWHSPAVLGVGFSYVPALRRVDDTSGATVVTSNVAATRWGVFLAVDVTVLPLL